MLGRLMKYDLRAMRRALMPMALVAAVVSLICCGIEYFFLLTESSELDQVLLSALSVSFYAIGLIGIVTMLLISCFLVAAHYYRSFFTDQGYLTMVIPVPVSTLFHAKLLSTAVILVAAMLLYGLYFFVAVFLAQLLYDPSEVAYVWELLQEIGGMAVGIAPPLPLLLLQNLTLIFENVLIIFAAITLGSVVMQRRKIIGSLLFFFLINAVYGVLTTVFSAILGATLPEESAGMIWLSYAMQILLSCLTGLAAYLLNLYILQRRFNIE